MPSETRYLTNKSFKGNILLDKEEYESLKKQNADLKAELKENQQISDRISSLIMERDDAKAKLSKAEQELIKLFNEYESDFTNREFWIDKTNQVFSRLRGE